MLNKGWRSSPGITQPGMDAEKTAWWKHPRASSTQRWFETARAGQPGNPDMRGPIGASAAAGLEIAHGASCFRSRTGASPRALTRSASRRPWLQRSAEGVAAAAPIKRHRRQ